MTTNSLLLLFDNAYPSYWLANHSNHFKLQAWPMMNPNQCTLGYKAKEMQSVAHFECNFMHG